MFDAYHSVLMIVDKFATHICISRQNLCLIITTQFSRVYNRLQEIAFCVVWTFCFFNDFHFNFYFIFVCLTICKSRFHPSPVTRYPSPATRYPPPVTRYPVPATRQPRKSSAVKLVLSRATTFHLTTHENTSFLACCEVVSLTSSSNVQSFLIFAVLLYK